MAARRAGRPNFILCLCDELRAFEVGCYGHPVVHTPHIDRLASEGLRFETAVSNNPVCMPARSVVISGQYSRTCCGSLGNTGLHPVEGGTFMPQYPSDGRPHLREKTLPEALREAGYQTTAIGKWHIESWPDEVGFDHYVIPRVHHCHHAQNFIEDGGHEFSPPGWTVDYEVQRARDYLQQRRDDDQPFFLYFNLSPPHMPLADAPEHYLNLYAPEDVMLRPNVDPSRPIENQAHRFATYLWDFRYYRDHLPYTRKLPEGLDLRRLTAMYYGLTTWVDDAVGRLLTAVEEAYLAEDTVVVFASDHGDNLGSHGRMGKTRLLEESIRVPLVMRGPGVRVREAPSPQVASLVDLAPTLLDLAGVQTPGHMPGRILSDVLRGGEGGGGGEGSAANNAAFIESRGEGVGVRTPTHLYGLPWGDRSRGTLGDAPHHFYDLRLDPYQLNNLAGASAQAPVAAELDRRLRAWHARTPWMEGAVART